MSIGAGAILIFMPGVQEIKSTMRCLLQHTTTTATSSNVEDASYSDSYSSNRTSEKAASALASHLVVLPLHGALPVHEQCTIQ